MGIVVRQSFLNTIIILVGFAIGGINVLFLYTHFLSEDYFGLVTFILSAANILLPLLVIGMQHTIIKFYSSYVEKKERDKFLSSSLFLPLLIILPVAFFGSLGYEAIADWLSNKNQIIKPYTGLIFITGIFMGYFEVFYAFSKVHFKSVFGNFTREIFARLCTSILLVAVYFNRITEVQFIYGIAIVYGLRAVIMAVYAFSIYRPKFSFKLPDNIREVLNYSGYIVLAGSASTILLEIDKFMIPQSELIAEVAYYAVGVYIASVTAIPARAMRQIITPITAKAINTNKWDEVRDLYKKSSITLLVVGGLLFLLINLNVADLYLVINKPQFSVGVLIVLMISSAELYKLALGTNGAILVNSKFFRMFFYFSLAMALSVIILNRWLIEKIGIDGAALATVIVVFVFSTIKIVYVHLKMKMQPFSKKTLLLFVLIVALFFLFYFVKFPWHPLVNILIKSVAVSSIYIGVVYKLKISTDINKLAQFRSRNK